MVSLSEDLRRNATIGDGMPHLENNVLTGDVRRSAPGNGKVKENPAGERLTEAQWVSRWDGEGGNFTLMCEEE